MQSPLSLYASKKLLPFLGKKFSSEIPVVSPDSVDPIFCWYADIYYYKRAKYLIFCNEISRFCFAVGPFKADAKADFMGFFSSLLLKNLIELLPDPEKYLDKSDGYGRITQSHRGASGHLSRLKVDLDYLKVYYPKREGRELQMPDEFWRVGDIITSRSGEKGFFHPKQRFLELWEKHAKPW